MAKETLATRLPEDLAGEVRAWARREDTNVSGLLRRLVEEGWAREQLPDVTFRGEGDSRCAALEDGPEVWKVMSVLPPEFRGEAVLVRRFAGVLEKRRVRQAVRCVERLPERVERHITANADAAGRLELRSRWSVPAGGLLAGWQVDRDAVDELSEEGYDVVSAADLEPPAGPVAALFERANEAGRVLLTADYRWMEEQARTRERGSYPVALLAPDLVQVDADDQAAAIAAWLEAGEGDERGPWIRPVDDA